MLHKHTLASSRRAALLKILFQLHSTVGRFCSICKLQQRMKRKLILLAAIAVTLLVWAPCLGLIASLGAASVFHCRVDEAGVYPCLIAGVDAGPLLADLMIGGWLLLVAWPLMLLTALGWLVWLILRIVRRVQRRGL